MRNPHLPLMAMFRRSVAVRVVLATLPLLACAPFARAAVAGAAPIAPATTIDAGQGTTYSVDRHTVDGGGGTSSGGNFEIQGTIGQPDADPLQPSTGGVFEITGGFWPGLAPAPPRPDALFANGFE